MKKLSPSEMKQIVGGAAFCLTIIPTESLAPDAAPGYWTCCCESDPSNCGPCVYLYTGGSCEFGHVAAVCI